jgi:hypothetical protein
MIAIPGNLLQTKNIVYAKRPSIAGIVITILWGMICLLGLVLGLYAFSDKDLASNLLIPVIMSVLFLMLVLIDLWILIRQLKRRRNALFCYMAFDPNSFHYHWMEDNFVIELTRLIKFNYSFYSAGNAQTWLEAEYREEDMSIKKRPLNHLAFPSRVNKIMLDQWLNNTLEGLRRDQ